MRTNIFSLLAFVLAGLLLAAIRCEAHVAVGQYILRSTVLAVSD